MKSKEEAMKKFEKLPFHARRVIERCRKGELLIRTYRMKETGEHETLYAFEPSGRRAPERGSEVAISSGFLTPRSDGLLDEASSQTFQATAA